MTAWLVVVATLAAAAAGPQEKARGQAPSSLTGDWIVVGEESTGRLHVSASGPEVTLSLASYDPEQGDRRVERYRLIDALGEAVVLDSVGPRQPGDVGAAPHLPPRARLLSISDTTALFWQPHRRALFAYRERPVPVAFLGRYTIDKGESDLRVIEVGVKTIVRPPDKSDSSEDPDDVPAPISILAVTDVQPQSVRLLLVTGTTSEALHIELHGDRATLVHESTAQEDRVLEAQFVPTRGQQGAQSAKPVKGDALATDKTKGRTVALPWLLGHFHVSTLTKNDEQTLDVSNSQWSFMPVGGRQGATVWPRVSAHFSVNAARMQLGSRQYGAESFTLRRFGDDCTLLEQDHQVHVLYREDAPPPWVPLAGLTEDVRLLCRELESAGPRLDDRAMVAAFVRTGRGARSDLMRAIVEAILEVPADQRASALERGLVDAGEPLPACAGVDRLRALPGQHRTPRRSDDE